MGSSWDWTKRHAEDTAANPEGHGDVTRSEGAGAKIEPPKLDPNAAGRLPATANAPGRKSMAMQKEARKKGGTKQLKAHSLIDKVYRWENLHRAYRRVWRTKGAHGLDRVTLRMVNPDWETHLREIQRKWMQRRYTGQPVRRVYIPKSSHPKERRPLGMPVVADRIVGQALIQVLDPIFDKQLSNRSFAYRKGRSAHDAITTIWSDIQDGYR